MVKTRTSVMGEVGDLSAAPGTRDWAIAVTLDIQATLNDVRGDAEHLNVMVSLMREHKGYRVLKDRKGRAFATYEAYCVEAPPFGLGYRSEDINHIIGERKAIQAKERAVKSRAVNPNGVKLGDRCSFDNVKGQPMKGGNDANYLTAKIARDRPDILDRMKAGEFTSVRKAALEAGLVTPTITLPLDPQRAARLLKKHFTGEAWQSLMDAIGGAVSNT